LNRLLGGTPAKRGDRFQETSPAELLPLGIEQILITGSMDRVIPPDLGREYEQEAAEKGDRVRFTLVEGAGHFDLIAPGSGAWPAVEEAVSSLLGIEKGGP
jgi:hypothetical protein